MTPLLGALSPAAWCLAGALAWGGWQRVQVYRLEARIEARVVADAAAEVAANRLSVARYKTMQEVSDAAQVQASDARAAAQRSADAAARLRAQVAGLVARTAGAPAPAAACGEAAGALGGVLSDCVARYQQLGAEASAARGAGLSCERAYDAVRGAVP